MTVAESDRPSPLQVNVNCVSAVNGPTVSLPEVAFEPDQPPDAVHELALLADQVSSVLSPAPMLGGFADKDTFGAGFPPGGGRPPLPPHALKVAASSAESHSCTQARVWVLIRRVLRLRPRRPRKIETLSQALARENFPGSRASHKLPSSSGPSSIAAICSRNASTWFSQ